MPHHPPLWVGCLCRCNGDRRDTPLVTETVQLGDMMRNSSVRCLRAYVVGACHDEHKVNRAILIKHPKEPTSMGANWCPHVVGCSLVEHVQSGEGAQPTNSNLARHSHVCQLRCQGLAIGLKLAPTAVEAGGVTVAIADDTRQTGSLPVAAVGRSPDHNVTLLFDNLNIEVLLLWFARWGPLMTNDRVTSIASWCPCDNGTYSLRHLA